MLLTDQELRAALEPILDRLLAQRLRYFQLELEPRLRSHVEAAVAAALGDQTVQGAATWSQALLRLNATPDPPACFAVAFELARGLHPGELALFVTLDGEAVLWAGRGVEPPARMRLEPNDVVGGAVARIATQLRTPQRSDGEIPVWSAADAAGAHAISIAGRCVGVLYWQGPRPPAPPQLQCLEALTCLAGLRLSTMALPS